MADLTPLGNQILASQPFSQLLGAELVALEPGRSEFVFVIRPDMLQHFEFVHGGVISSAADMALTFVGGTALGTQILTLEIKVNYLRPAVCCRLRAIGTVVSSSARHAVCRCDIYAEDEEKSRLVAIGQGTIAVLVAPAQGETAQN